MLADDQNFMCREFDMVAFENLLLHLNSGGRLVITLPGRITFASGKVSDLRQFIQPKPAELRSTYLISKTIALKKTTTSWFAGTQQVTGSPDAPLLLHLKSQMTLS